MFRCLFFLLILNFGVGSYKCFAQLDSLRYTVGLGLSAINFWKDGLKAYEYNLNQNISNDLIDSGNLFINNFTLNVKVQRRDKFGRLTYLVTNDWNRSVRIKMLNLTYGMNWSYLRDKIILGAESGVGYGLIIDVKNLTVNKSFAGIIGFNFNIPVWKGIRLQNKFNGLFTVANKNFYLNHSFSIAYTF